MDLCRRAFLPSAFALIFLGVLGANEVQNWPSFRGPGGRGVADGFPVRSSWNADPTAG